MRFFHCAPAPKSPTEDFFGKADLRKIANNGNLGLPSIWAIDCLKSDVIGVDIDAAKVGRVPAWQTWHDLCLSWGLPKALPPFTQSARGGWHVLVKRPPGHILVQRDIAPCINTRTSGYLVAPESFYDGTAKGEESGHYIEVAGATIHECPSSEILRQRAAQIKGGSGSLVDDVRRLAVGAASGVGRWSGV